MPKEIWNEGRVVGFSAYELYVKHHLAEDPTSQPASENEWLASTIALGSSLLLKVDGSSAVETEESGYYTIDIPLPKDTILVAANTIIGSLFTGEAVFNNHGVATRVSSYGPLLDNSAGAAGVPWGELLTSEDMHEIPSSDPSTWIATTQAQLVDYLKILDGIVINPGDWVDASVNPPEMDFSPNFTGDADEPIVRLLVKGEITTDPVLLLTGFTIKSVISGTSGVDTSLQTAAPQNGDFLGPAVFPWANKIVFSLPNNYAAFAHDYTRVINPIRGAGDTVTVSDVPVIDMRETDPDTFFANYYTTGGMSGDYLHMYGTRNDPRIPANVSQFPAPSSAVLTTYSRDDSIVPSALYGSVTEETGDTKLAPIDVVAPGTVKMLKPQSGYESAAAQWMADYEGLYPANTALMKKTNGDIYTVDSNGELVPVNSTEVEVVDVDDKPNNPTAEDIGYGVKVSTNSESGTSVSLVDKNNNALNLTGHAGTITHDEIKIFGGSNLTKFSDWYPNFPSSSRPVGLGFRLTSSDLQDAASQVSVYVDSVQIDSSYVFRVSGRSPGPGGTTPPLPYLGIDPDCIDQLCEGRNYITVSVSTSERTVSDTFEIYVNPNTSVTRYRVKYSVVGGSFNYMLADTYVQRTCEPDEDGQVTLGYGVPDTTRITPNDGYSLTGLTWTPSTPTTATVLDADDFVRDSTGMLTYNFTCTLASDNQDSDDSTDKNWNPLIVPENGYLHWDDLMRALKQNRAISLIGGIKAGNGIFTETNPDGTLTVSTENFMNYTEYYNTDTIYFRNMYKDDSSFPVGGTSSFQVTTPGKNKFKSYLSYASSCPSTEWSNFNGSGLKNNAQGLTLHDWCGYSGSTSQVDIKRYADHFVNASTPPILLFVEVAASRETKRVTVTNRMGGSYVTREVNVPKYVKVKTKTSATVYNKNGAVGLSFLGLNSFQNFEPKHTNSFTFDDQDKYIIYAVKFIGDLAYLNYVTGIDNNVKWLYSFTPDTCYNILDVYKSTQSSRDSSSGWANIHQGYPGTPIDTTTGIEVTDYRDITAYSQSSTTLNAWKTDSFNCDVRYYDHTFAWEQGSIGETYTPCPRIVATVDQIGDGVNHLFGSGNEPVYPGDASAGRYYTFRWNLQLSGTFYLKD